MFVRTRRDVDAELGVCAGELGEESRSQEGAVREISWWMVGWLDGWLVVVGRHQLRTSFLVSYRPSRSSEGPAVCTGG